MSLQRLQHDLVMRNSFLDCCDRAKRWDLALHILTQPDDDDVNAAQHWDVALAALFSFGIVKQWMF